MLRILSFSSLVAKGHVGLSIVVPALEALGFDVIAVPTVILSNHKGYDHCAGLAVPPDTLSDILRAIADNGWLDGVDGVISGYLPSPEHVALVAATVDGLRSTRAKNAAQKPLTYLCDPVMGDTPGGLYVSQAVADAMRTVLMPQANIATPNAFEAHVLSDARRPPTSAAEVRTAAAALTPETVVVTSVANTVSRQLSNIAICTDGTTLETRVDLRPSAPHGTGDMFAAMLLAAHLDGRALTDALAFATATVDHALCMTAARQDARGIELPGPTDLNPSDFVRSFDDVGPWPVTALTSGTA